MSPPRSRKPGPPRLNIGQHWTIEQMAAREAARRGHRKPPPTRRGVAGWVLGFGLVGVLIFGAIFWLAC